MYTRIWFELQCVGILLGECLTVKNYWGLLTDKNFAHGRCLPYGQQNKLNLLHKMLPTYDESLNE